MGIFNSDLVLRLTPAFRGGETHPKSALPTPLWSVAD
jgi:hypothetical protein